jgi:hypothetical protein
MMGGKIGIKSTLDVGSTFTAVLPMNPTVIVTETQEPMAVAAAAMN